ncbi:MAG: D-2-hydroxyacid dehydrogenase [Chloroflexi bacterium]|nr:MAG: D-2-hydroxyacid dehydrogenase [Chloroflexota bacterium]
MKLRPGPTVRSVLIDAGSGGVVLARKFLFLPPTTETIRNWATRLAAAVPQLQVVVAEDLAEAEQAIGEADAAFGTLPPPLLARAQKLRWLQAPAAAPPAGYYYPELVQHPVSVTNFRGIYNDHIAAHILAFLLAFARGLHRYLPQQLRKEWQPAPPDTGVVYLPESTALILGVGGIGGETARLCAAFGIRVIGIDARPQALPAGMIALHGPDRLDQLLPQADWVIMTIPHTPETEGLMNMERFRLMKSSAFLINIGRGMTVKLDDLNLALRAGMLGGAGLDVFEQEPLPPDHALWTAPNVLLTPHTAGYGPYLDERRLALIIDNAQRFVTGADLRNVVDKRLWF